MNAFTQALKLKRYALYVFDYGAPTGFRQASAHPDRVTGIVSQNGNAYEEGPGSSPIIRWIDLSSIPGRNIGLLGCWPRSASMAC